MTAVSFSSSREVSVARHLAGGRSPSQRRSATRSEVFVFWQSSGSTLQYPDAIIGVSVSVSSTSLSSPSAMPPAAARGWRGLLVVVVLVTMLYRGVRCVSVLEFQKDNMPTTDSFAYLDLKELEIQKQNTRTVTVCVWIRPAYFRRATFLLSYSTGKSIEGKDNMLALIIYPKSFRMVIHGSSQPHVPVNMFPGRWVHICAVTDGRYYTGYVRGTQVMRKRKTAKSVPLNGTLLIGQDQDDILKGFNKYQSYSGDVTLLGIWGEVLEPEQIRAMASCSREANGNIVSWRSMWKRSEQVKSYEIAKEELCKREKSFYIFPESLTYRESTKLCSKAGLTLALPRSLREEERLYGQAERFVPQCRLSASAHSFLWLGARKSPNQRDVFTDAAGWVLNYTHFVLPFVRSQMCAALIEGPVFGWNDVSCEDRFCVACEERDGPPLFSIRGLRDGDDWASMEFVLDQEDPDDSLYLRGLDKYTIKRGDPKGGALWQLRDVWRNVTVGSSHEPYPFGTKLWGPRHIILTLTACSEGDFTCADGSCIPIESRCDLRVDCEDASDEEKCSKVSRPKGYLASLPPPSLHASDALGIQVSVSISSISEIEALRSFVALGLTLKMSWYDSRLSFENLQDLEDINGVQPKSSTWIPSYIFENADLSGSFGDNSHLLVRKVGSPLEDNKERFLPDRLYSGGENPLVLQERKPLTFSCHMNLRLFPFDTQKCRLVLRLTSAPLSLLAFTKISVEYTGDTNLPEFIVKGLEASIPNTTDSMNSKTYSQAFIFLTFQRRYIFYVTSAYVPSAMLLAVTLASLWCDPANRDLRVMMSLTTLLVAQELHGQITAHLPRTAYLRAIDIWFLFIQSSIFSVTPKGPKGRPCWGDSSSSSQPPAGSSSARRMLHVARMAYSIFIPLVVALYFGCIFFLVYKGS
ncbi:hypothetical protein C7M84_012080 [Penaeus vannamei]|uniref:Uncharacterized protein n=1 Tax=Penaeus vannamei TaxID=6689 RepID=A0A3R7NXT0_PENVA|nr:hypothetical protein C7M84_012080 [Penaeus vannamei]